MSTNKILVVVDMQKDFVDGSLGTPEAQAIVPNVEEKIRNGDYYAVVYTLDTHRSSYLDTLEGKKLPVKHCIEYTDGWALAVSTHSSDEDYVVTKNTFGYLDWANEIVDIINDVTYKTDIEIEPEEIEFELCGLCTDICVISNALILRATYPDNIITVDASCCAGTTPEAHKAALTVMKSCQIDVINEE